MDNDSTLLKMVAALIVRHAMTTLAGAFVTLGILSASDQSRFETMLGGVVLGLAGLGWSWWQKVGAARLAADLAKLKANIGRR